MEFKKRARTSYIYVVKMDFNGADQEKLRRAAIRCGEFDLGVHYVLFANGELVKERPIDVIAGWKFSDADESLYILADSKGKLSDSQRLTLRQVCQDYQDAELIEV